MVIQMPINWSKIAIKVEEDVKLKDGESILGNDLIFQCGCDC